MLNIVYVIEDEVEKSVILDLGGSKGLGIKVSPKRFEIKVLFHFTNVLKFCSPPPCCIPHPRAIP